MKKKLLLISIFILMFSFNVYATSGKIRQSSVMECNGKYYGNHGSPIHWHIVEKKNNVWVSISGEVGVPACYLKKVNTKEKVKFSKCSDGDTAHFIINDEIKKVRFLAIDAPELAKNGKSADLFANEASEYTCNALKKAKNIYLEYDGNSDREDKYGRVLAFVHTDEELLQAKLVENGYAKVAYIYGDYAYVEELRELEAKAKKQKLGIWRENKEDIKLADEKITKDDILQLVYKIIYKYLRVSVKSFGVKS